MMNNRPTKVTVIIESKDQPPVTVEFDGSKGDIEPVEFDTNTIPPTITLHDVMRTLPRPWQTTIRSCEVVTSGPVSIRW